MCIIVQILRKKRIKKNYQEILIEYLNNLNNSNSKIDFVAKEIKTAFFSCLNDLVLNKNDELKYLILMLEEKYKKIEREKYFKFWQLLLNKKNNEKELANYKYSKNDKDSLEKNNINGQKIQINSNLKKKNIKFKMETDDENDNEEESNTIFPDDDYIESLREQNSNDINKISNKEQIKNNILNDIIRINSNEQRKEKQKKKLINAYDDETNSSPPGYKSGNSDKNNIPLIGNEKYMEENSKKNESFNLNKNNKSINNNNNDYFNVINNIKDKYYKENLNIIKEENNINDKIKINKNINYKKEEKKVNNDNSKSKKIRNKFFLESNSKDIIEKKGKSFNEYEEENRLNYLLSSKKTIKENEAKNIINLKKTINEAIKKTNYKIQKINEHETNTHKTNLTKKINNITPNNIENNIQIKKNNLEIEEISQITLDFSNINKTKSTINEPINVENINLIGDFDNNKKIKSYNNNLLIIERIKIDPFNNGDYIIQNNMKNQTEKISNKLIEQNNQEKFSIIYNKEFSFAPKSSSHNKDNDINYKNKNKIINNNNENLVNNINKPLKELTININELINSKNSFINQKNINNIEKKDNLIINENIDNSINIFKDKEENNDRLINEEMIKNFLNNNKIERIFQIDNNQNTDIDNNIKNEDKNDIDIKNKYLGYTLEGTNRNKETKNETEPNKNKNKLNTLDNDNLIDIEDDINKIKVYQSRDNENNNSGLNKICNMLDDLFIEDKNEIKKFNSEKYYIEKFNNKEEKKNNDIKYLNNNYLFNNISKINTNTLNISNFNTNELIFNEQIPFNQNNNDNINEDINYKNNNNMEYISNQRKVFDNINNIKHHNNYKMSFPLSTMSFDQRMQHFSNKKYLDLEKIKNNIINEEEGIYTFYPRTNKTIKKINYDYKSKSKSKIYKNSQNNESKRKGKINYKRLNELYMDYKERNIRIKNLEKENDIKDGISFIPQCFSNKSYLKKKSKEKIIKIPFLNKLENI